MANAIVILLFGIATFLQTTDRYGVLAARVLGVFPHHGYSHHLVFLPYLRALADRGHNVHVISNFESSHPNIININIKGFVPMKNNNVTFPAPDSWSFGISNLWLNMMELYNMAKSTEGLFSVPAVRRMINDRSVAFDLIIFEHFNSELPLGFVARYRAPFVLLSSCPLLPWTMPVVGQPPQMAYRPSTFSGLSKSMNLAQRLANIINTYVSATVFQAANRYWSQQMIKKHFDLDMSLEEFASNASLVLVNTHWTINGAFPIVPAVLEIGGIHIHSAKRLPTVSILIFK